jgi:hypothetical protein
MNAESIYSRIGYVIQYAGCPVNWQSKLQTGIALSTAEVEYGAISGIKGDSSNIKSDEGNQCHLPTLFSITQVHYQSERGQSILH